MLSFPFSGDFFCDANFLYKKLFLYKKGLGVFYISIYINKWKLWKPQKTPKNLVVKNVTLIVASNVIGIGILLHESIKWKLMEINWKYKKPQTIINVIYVINITRLILVYENIRINVLNKNKVIWLIILIKIQ